MTPTIVFLGGADRVISTSDEGPLDVGVAGGEAGGSALVLGGTITLGADLELLILWKDRRQRRTCPISERRCNWGD